MGGSYWLIFRVEMSTAEKLRDFMYNRREIGGTETVRCLTAVLHTGSDSDSDGAVGAATRRRIGIKFA